ncbi:hypothetical protein FHX75_11938 [Micromonospora palomenae]|uniref:Uncharacterized protein n=1 Tax=Micromonospora palomenae TaxID=1461247 RepID=A0A561WVA7_9ACTN|nr:hypothetical protein [Micromonospora palomenae]TWG27790.1 hypothetical protein FHX75_11938 [Micromonospora palomenae]
MLLDGDAVEQHRRPDGPDIAVLGSGELVRSPARPLRGRVVVATYEPA